MTGRHSSHSTTDMPCSAATVGAEADAWVRKTLHQRIIGAIAPRHLWDAATMRFSDLFFVRYSTEEGAQRGLPMHRDASNASFNILLNPPSDFEGGGTIIECEAKTYSIGQGDCLVHAGNVRHAGANITRGERLVLVGFLKGGEKKLPF